jgi:hypothetical protein
MSPDMNTIEHAWNFVGRKVTNVIHHVKIFLNEQTHFWKNGSDSHKRSFVAYFVELIGECQSFGVNVAVILANE